MDGLSCLRVALKGSGGTWECGDGEEGLGVKIWEWGFFVFRPETIFSLLNEEIYKNRLRRPFLFSSINYSLN